MIETKFIELPILGSNDEYGKAILNVNDIKGIFNNDISNDNTTTIMLNYSTNMSMRCKYSYKEMLDILDRVDHVYKPLENIHLDDKTE